MLNTLLAHWDDILAIYGGIVAVCTTIVKLTPSTKDDAVLAKIIKIVDYFSTAFTKADAEKLEKKEGE
jgi:hypothetical protein